MHSHTDKGCMLMLMHILNAINGYNYCYGYYISNHQTLCSNSIEIRFVRIFWRHTANQTFVIHVFSWSFLLSPSVATVLNWVVNGKIWVFWWANSKLCRSFLDRQQINASYHTFAINHVFMTNFGAMWVLSWKSFDSQCNSFGCFYCWCCWNKYQAILHSVTHCMYVLTRGCFKTIKRQMGEEKKQKNKEKNTPWTLYYGKTKCA